MQCRGELKKERKKKNMKNEQGRPFCVVSFEGARRVSIKTLFVSGPENEKLYTLYQRRLLSK
jgi:hypothetical protein